MIVRKFQADTVAQALSQVKQKMGDEAVVLHTKHYRKGLWLGLVGKQVVEITASYEPSQTSKTISSIEKIETPANAISQKELQLLQRELNEIKGTLASLVKKAERAYPTSLPETYLPFYQHLLDQDVSEKLAQKMVETLESIARQSELTGFEALSSELEKIFLNIFHRSSPVELKAGESKKVMLVGPTGVGKTTTLAKLAAHFLLKEHKKVALITLDTYRIAAAEQLRIYAEIMHLPLEAVSSVQELKKAIEKYQACDLILIDTAGRSHRHNVQMLELANLIKMVEPDEIHLVLSLAAQRKNVFDVIEQFQSVRFDKVLFTKLDEAATLGLLLEVLCVMDKAVSYVCHGQNVPEDIDVFKSAIYAKVLAQGGPLVRSSLASEKISS